MTELDLILQAPHEADIRSLLSMGAGVETAGYLLFGLADIAADPWSGRPRRRFVSHAFRSIPAAHAVSASAVHVTWSTDGFMRLLGDAVNEGLIPAIVHTHPGGPAAFSGQDDRNEAELARTASLKGAPGLISLLINGEGLIAARYWAGRDRHEPISRILHAGSRITITETAGPGVSPDFLDRQIRLFGDRANATIANLRCGVAGGGGTGSAVLPLLMRHGVRNAILFEKDAADHSNLNRLHGARRTDADVGAPKAEIHQRTVREADLGMNLVTLNAFAGDPESWDALKACDVIFSCTDDHAGRLFLNRFSRFYGIPVIDVGLAMQRRTDGGFDLFARVSTLVAGHACLVCGNNVNPRRAREETLMRRDPDAYEALKKEAYVLGEGEPAPAVAAFTTEAGCLAIGELLAAVTGFHGDSGMRPVRIRRFHACDDRFPAIAKSPECPACEATSTLGRGDCDPFLDMVT
ncbi:ThiF family adenylyltransferase [Hyphococcus luteus]|uniref:Thiamine biosynthesis protein ThiF n=1 Tax=Hyphococcus luteus TaxID=2058213 RepID=A0A2S7K046_9PROT|nr:ThiF family adenylyltransferase [Marinicaulis flavus]PQA85879.1 thiamine biosynthesis protein ThiF [Marinicaulis flavus]